MTNDKKRVQGVATLWLDTWRKLGQVKNATSQTKNSASTIKSQN
jgi:hypothetical protein